ncbi:MAG: hypothetical protein IKP88_12455 [Lachnospiraceae bacterium]|nr:hypothetical protein [Lachnospiraceae bacterium]
MSRRVRKMSGVSLKGVMLFICIILLLCAFGAAFYMFKNARDDVEESYRNRISELEEKIDRYTVPAYRAKEYIQAGSVLHPDMCEKYDILTESSEIVTDEDFGKKVLIDIKPGDELTKNILAGDENGVLFKEAEYNFINIPENVETDNYVDIRLRYPDGTDYVVVSKKKITGLDSSRKKIYLQMSEEEILLMDSALVDTYRYPDSVIYLTKYIFPEKENPSVVNYSPSVPLYELIRENPNIQAILAGSISVEERIGIENSLFGFSSSNGGASNNNEKEKSPDTEHGGSIWD